MGDDKRPDEAHKGIHPHPGVDAACQQRRDDQHGSQSVGEYVQKGGAQVVIMVVVRMAGFANARVAAMSSMAVAMSIIAAQQPCAHKVNRQSSERDGNRLVEFD